MKFEWEEAQIKVSTTSLSLRQMFLLERSIWPTILSFFPPPANDNRKQSAS